MAQLCPKCKGAMIRVDIYDPDGLLSIEVQHDLEGHHWCCTNSNCEDGKRNQ